jgi:hypothetical protein
VDAQTILYLEEAGGRGGKEKLDRDARRPISVLGDRVLLDHLPP